MNVRDLNTLDDTAAESALAPCCASTAWVGRMMAARPFRNTTTLLATAEEVWWDLSAEDWEEAFAGHRPDAIGPDGGLRREFESAAGEYAATFGYPFITAKADPAEILETCRDRLSNDPLTELGTAAVEMARVVNVRLRRLLEMD